jgi:NADH:ubiquinone oxidoreductase subunit 6 (subunit J)
MSLADLIFYFFIALTVLATIGMLVVKNVFHAALLLIVCLLSIAGVYILLHAEFLAVTQIMIYAGGILVVIIFGVMLSSRIAGKPLYVEDSRTPYGYLVGAGMLYILSYSIYTAGFSFASTSQQPMQNPVKDVGFLLMSNFVVPFEVAGLLLLISLIGAAVTASTLNHKKI